MFSLTTQGPWGPLKPSLDFMHGAVSVLRSGTWSSLGSSLGIGMQLIVHTRGAFAPEALRMSSPGEDSRGLTKCTILPNDQKHLGKASGTALCEGEGAKRKGPA